jgi:hypothetical protein
MSRVVPCSPNDSYDEFYWKLNEPTGSSVVKNYGTVGSAMDGTDLANVTLGARQSPFGVAPNFTGATSWIRTARNGTRGTGPSATVSAWFYLTNVSNLSSFFQQVYGDGLADPWCVIQLMQTGGGAGLFVEVNSSARNGYNTAGNITAIPMWQHAALSYDSATGRRKAYIGGVLVANDVVASGAISWGPSNGFIDVGTGILGSVCEVRMSNTVRSDDYIRKMYQSGLARLYQRGVI